MAITKDDRKLVVLFREKQQADKKAWGIVWEVDAGETITESDWTVTPDDGEIVLISSHHHTDDTTWFWASGGARGQSYRFENTITTSQSREFTRSVVLRVL